MVLFSSSFYKWALDATIYVVHEDKVAKCKESWWLNLLYLNNIYTENTVNLASNYLHRYTKSNARWVGKNVAPGSVLVHILLIKYLNWLLVGGWHFFLFQCGGQTWYLSAEMQIFIVTPFMLYPMWHFQKYQSHYIMPGSTYNYEKCSTLGSTGWQILSFAFSVILIIASSLAGGAMSYREDFAASYAIE